MTIDKASGNLYIGLSKEDLKWLRLDDVKKGRTAAIEQPYDLGYLTVYVLEENDGKITGPKTGR